MEALLPSLRAARNRALCTEQGDTVRRSISTDQANSKPLHASGAASIFSKFRQLIIDTLPGRCNHRIGLHSAIQKLHQKPHMSTQTPNSAQPLKIPEINRRIAGDACHSGTCEWSSRIKTQYLANPAAEFGISYYGGNWEVSIEIFWEVSEECPHGGLAFEFEKKATLRDYRNVAEGFLVRFTNPVIFAPPATADIEPISIKLLMNCIVGANTTVEFDLNGDGEAVIKISSPFFETIESVLEEPQTECFFGEHLELKEVSA